MAAAVTLERARWLGHRWRRHGLAGHAAEGEPAGADVLADLLLLGVQGSGRAGAEQAIAQRTGAAGDAATAVTPTGPLVSLWSVRGAPHAHPLDQVDAVREALAPREPDDGGAAEVAAVEEVAAAFTAIVTGPTPKPEASSELTRRVDASLAAWCEPCQAVHVPEPLFRSGGRQAGVVLGLAGRSTVLHPPPRRMRRRLAPGSPESPDDPRAALVRAFVRVNGPTGRPQVRDWAGLGSRAVAGPWSALGTLVRVGLEGRRLQVPEALVEELRDAPPARGVVLVPPHDPYLEQADRTLLVPDKARRQEVWRAVSGPGALLVDGEVAGTWRYRRTERELTVTPFEGLTAARRKQAEAGARLVAAASGDEPPAVVWA